ncbi:helix-turn-helix domain-containing protein [Rubritalea tangerina]
MQKACSLLATTEDKIEVIAKAVGYRSAFHFSNVFSNG